MPTIAIRFYAELGRYLEEGNNYGIASLMFGKSFLVGGDGRTVLYPHGFVGVEYTSNDPVAKTSTLYVDGAQVAANAALTRANTRVGPAYWLLGSGTVATAATPTMIRSRDPAGRRIRAHRRRRRTGRRRRGG